MGAGASANAAKERVATSTGEELVELIAAMSPRSRDKLLEGLQEDEKRQEESRRHREKEEELRRQQQNEDRKKQEDVRKLDVSISDSGQWLNDEILRFLTMHVPSDEVQSLLDKALTWCDEKGADKISDIVEAGAEFVLEFVDHLGLKPREKMCEALITASLRGGDSEWVCHHCFHRFNDSSRTTCAKCSMPREVMDIQSPASPPSAAFATRSAPPGYSRGATTLPTAAIASISSAPPLSFFGLPPPIGAEEESRKNREKEDFRRLQEKELHKKQEGVRKQEEKTESKKQEMACVPYHPTHIRPDDQFSVMVWTSLAEQIELIEREMSARQKDFDHEMIPAEEGSFKADPEDQLDIELVLPSESLELLWVLSKEPSAAKDFLHFEMFECRCKNGATPGMAACEVKVFQSGKELICQPFKVCIEPVVELLERAASNVERKHGYNVGQVSRQIHKLIRDSIHLYHQALRNTRSQDDQALRELMKMEPEDLYAENGRVDQRAAELMPLNESKRKNFVRVEPVQSAGDKETLRSHATIAQKLLKEHIAEGSTQGEAARVWAEITEHDHVVTAGKTERRRGAGKSFATVPYSDAAFDPGLKSDEGVERKVKRYNGAYNRVRDISRLGLLFNSPRALLHAVDRLRASKAFRLVKIENRFRAPTSLGWMDITCLVEFRVGEGMWHVSEIQLQLTEFNDAREGSPKSKRQGAHEFYEHIRQILPQQCNVPAKKMDEVIDTMLTEFTSPPMHE